MTEGSTRKGPARVAPLQSGSRRADFFSNPTVRRNDVDTVRCSVPQEFSSAVVPTDPAAHGEEPTPELPAERFDDRGEIARGGMGSVRKAFDNVLLRQVAMKVMERSPDDPSDAVLRFLEEAQITGQLDHPNIVPVHDLGRADPDEQAYFTMKLVTGKTFADALREARQERLDSRTLERVLQIFLRVCDAVSFAHSRGVIHRDLKPANIMVGTHGQVYVMDWGVALLLGSPRPSETDQRARVTLSRDPAKGNLEEPGTIVGTVAYMAPEQARGRTDLTDERTDVFGLGAILYELLTGRAPNLARTYEETLAAARRGAWEPPESCGAWPDLPPGLCEIAKKALARNPEERQQSVDELKREVEQFMRGGGWFATRMVAAGEHIVREGEPSDAAFVITSGRCEVYKNSGRERMSLRTLAAGDVFGETGVFSSQPRTASVVALDDVTVKVVTRESLEQELDRNEWMRAFVKTLATRFLEVDTELTKLRREKKKP